MTGPVNSKKTTRHHAHLSLCVKSRKTNNAESRKWPKTSIWTIFRGHIFRNYNFFLKNRSHSNWSSYLALTSGQKRKKSLGPFLRKNIKVSDFGLIWRLFCEYLRMKIFFKNLTQLLFYLYGLLTSCKKSQKILRAVSGKTALPANQPTNQKLPTTPIL